MNARKWSGCGLAIALIASLCQASFAEDERPSRDTLSDMGLSGLRVVSDEDALSIRGQGFKRGTSARAWGNSYAFVRTKKGSAGSVNGYHSDGKHFAAGGNYSFAGATVKKSSRKGGKYGRPSGNNGGHKIIKSVKVYAGGNSWAVAF